MDWGIIKLLAQNLRIRLIIPILLVTLTAITVSYVVQCNRKAYTQLQQIFMERNEADVKWGQLLLQYGTLTSYGRIEDLAKNRLHMLAPDQKKIILVKP